MKISRCKSGFFLVVLAPLALFLGLFSLNIFNNLIGYADVVKVYSAVNYASMLALFVAVLITLLLMLLVFFSGNSLRWLPKIVIVLLGGLVFFAFGFGWYIQYSVKNELGERGYIECTSERELSLKYSSRTYVLEPEKCSKAF